MRAAGMLPALLGCVLALAPLVILAIMSFSGQNNLLFPPDHYSTKWYGELVSDSAWSDAIKTSTGIAGLSTVLAVVIGIPTGLGLSRGLLGRITAVQALVATPLVLPVVSMAFGFYFVSAYLSILNTPFPLVLFQLGRSLPLVILTVIAADKGLDTVYERAARTLGASFSKTIRTIVLPLIAPGIVAGTVFAFIHSWGDVTGPIFLGSPRANPLPLQIWNSISFTLTPILAAATTFLSLGGLAVAGVVSVLYVLRRRRLSDSVVESAILRQESSK
ncbi:ABC transporter permease [Acrocarpospora macrocephala]